MLSDPKFLEKSYRICRRICRRSHSSFPVGFALLPRPQRRAMYALYALLRFADDLVDDAPEAVGEDACAGDSRRQKIEALRLRLQRVLQKNAPPSSAPPGQYNYPMTILPVEWILPALGDAVERFRSRPRPFWPYWTGWPWTWKKKLRHLRRTAAVLRARGFRGRRGLRSHLGIPPPRGRRHRA